MPRRPSLVCFDTCLPPMRHGVPQQRHAPCHGASATRPSTLLTLTTYRNDSAPRFPLFVTCFWSQATSGRFSVPPPPRERPPPSPSPTSLSRPPLTLAACCEAATTSSLLNSFPGTSTCAAQRPASATSAAAASAATTTTAEVSVGVGVARARADDGGGGGGGHGCVLCHRRRRPAVHANDGALRARHARTAGRWRRRRRRLIEINHFFKIKLFKKKQRSHTRRSRGPRRNTWRSSFLVWLRQTRSARSALNVLSLCFPSPYCEALFL